MAQYSMNPILAEAYQIGNATVPTWVSTALAAHTIKPNLKSSGPNPIMKADGLIVATPDGPVAASTGDYLIQASDGTLTVVDQTTFETNYLLDVAALLTVLTKTDATPGTEDGTTAETAIAWGISVLNAVETVGLANITASTDATINLYSDATFETAVTGTDTIALTAGDDTMAYIKVTSKHGTLIRYYAVTIARAAGT